MKSIVGLAVLAGTAIAGVAHAQQAPLDPYGAPVYVAPAVVAAPPPAAPLQPYPPPPPGYYFTPPPVYVAPPPRVYVVPAPRRAKLACRSCGQRPVDRARYFSFGVRGSFLGINQQINGQDVVLGGFGLQTRFRTRGRFGIEAGLDFLHGDFKAQGGATPMSGPATGPSTTPYFHVGDVSRDSIPFSLTALVYVFPNTDARIFNIFFLGGVGVVSTTMNLTDEYGNHVSQDFTEYEGHLGGGIELRFHWFALDASVRGFALSRDDSTAPASYYKGVEGGPVPSSSYGYQGTLAATLWF